MIAGVRQRAPRAAGLVRQAWLAAALASTGADVEAVQSFQGQSASGAFYTIEAPDDWTPAAGLVIYNHGFDIDQVMPDPDLGVLAEFVLEQGFAVAASSYSLNGWALFQTVADNRQLYQAVIDHLGEPEQVLVFGGSLGALVTMQAVEQGGIGSVVGAYPLCGPLYGSEVWRRALDLRLVYDAVCDGVSGGELPGGASGLPFALEPDQYDGILGDLTATAVGSAVIRCTGVEVPDLLQTSGQRERRQAILDATRISEAFLGINLAYATFVLSDLYHDERKLDRRQPLGNVDVDYGDPVINDQIKRIVPEPLDALDFKRAYTPTGDVGAVKVLATTTDKDGLVVAENLYEYQQRIDPRQFVSAVVVEEEPSHCGYAEAEIVAGWEQLLDWIETENQPSADDLQKRCVEILDEGHYAGPCRYEPDFQNQPIGHRIRARPNESPLTDSRLSGSFFIPGAGGQGWFIEVLDAFNAVMYWFTYSPNGAPIWIGGVGKRIDDSLVFDEAFTTQGARFGSAFNAADVELMTWGSLDFVFTADAAGVVRYRGPDEYGAGTATIQQLTRLSGASCDEAPSHASLSGLWYPPDRPGEGILLEVQADGRIFAAWFTYDPNGQQTWLYGEGVADGPASASVLLQQFAGPVFGADYDANDLQARDWGRLTISLVGNDALMVAYETQIAAYGSLEPAAWVRLTRPLAQCGSLEAERGASWRP